MFKSLICCLGVCSFLHATIDVMEVSRGVERSLDVTSIIVSAIDKPIEELNAQLDKRGEHLFIGLDGKVTCFVPNDAQLENREKFPSKSEKVRKMRDKVKDINDGDYDELADYLMHSCCASENSNLLCAWDGVTGCYDFSINIMLQRLPETSNHDLEAKDGSSTVDLYTDKQIDVVHDVLLALVNKGISKKNILGLSDIGLSVVHIAPYTSFWRQLNERYSGFLPEPRKSTTHNINSASKLKKVLSRIGYTNPIDPETNAKFIGEDCWVRRAVNAFIFHYLPEENFKFNGLDRNVVREEVAYAEDNTSFDKSLSEFLGNNKQILNIITKDGERSVDNLDELSDALGELGYKIKEGERRKEMIARAVNNESKKLFGDPAYHQHTFIYPPEGTCYSKELTYNILRDKYPYILSAIDQISNL